MMVSDSGTRLTPFFCFLFVFFINFNKCGLISEKWSNFAFY